MSKVSKTYVNKGIEMNADAISVAYDGASKRLILDGVTLDLTQGQFVALVGPNGSGKSTLIRALSRTLKPQIGTVTLDGQNLYSVVDSRSAAREIGVVPQDTTVAFEFTAREIVAMGRAPHQPRFSIMPGESEADHAAIDRALAATDIGENLAVRPINSLSGGERQRVLIARAIAQDARILLLDEPTASLDPRHEADVMDLLRGLAKTQGHIVLAALHDLNLAARYADRVIVLDNGNIVADGTPGDALTVSVIKDVYGVDVWVRQHPIDLRPYFLPISKDDDAADPNLAGKRVHVICGAGTGVHVIHRLVASRAIVTVGVLDSIDPDAKFAQSSGIEPLTVSAFSVIGPGEEARMIKAASDADIVVVTAFPIGAANIGNLRALVKLALLGKLAYVDDRLGTNLAKDIEGEAKVLIATLRESASVVYEGARV